MKALLTLMVAMVAWLSSAANAQTLVHFVPPEGDFRVLLPEPPTRQTLANGAVEFRAISGDLRFLVIRHPPGPALQMEQARDHIRQRLSEERTARDMSDGMSGLESNEIYFRTGSTRSLHRVILDRGRFYELVMQTQDEDSFQRLAAVDFFNSFQMGLGLGRFSALARLPTPDTCAARGNPFTRRFCEYVTCLAPGQEGNPICTALPRLRLQ